MDLHGHVPCCPFSQARGRNAEVNFDRDFSSAPADTRVNVVSSVSFYRCMIWTFRPTCVEHALSGLSPIPILQGLCGWVHFG